MVGKVCDGETFALINHPTGAMWNTKSPYFIVFSPEIPINGPMLRHKEAVPDPWDALGEMT